MYIYPDIGKIETAEGKKKYFTMFNNDYFNVSVRGDTKEEVNVNIGRMLYRIGIKYVKELKNH